ncbi:MAG: hypothetical protein SF029_11840 [bacterium]|nr:hypothetical protein [bacterium]
MAISVFWDNEEKTLLRWEVKGEWTPEEFREAGVKTFSLTTMTENEFHLIINVNHTTPPPFPLPIFQEALRSASPQLCSVVVVKADDFSRSMLQTLKHHKIPFVREGRLHIADSMHEARHIIAEVSSNRALAIF